MFLMGALFIPRPWLALIPVALFLLQYRLTRRKVASLTAMAWLSYAIYEHAMHQRWLCSGECNIRIDLLLIYPLLLVLSAAALTIAIVRRHPPEESST